MAQTTKEFPKWSYLLHRRVGLGYKIPESLSKFGFVPASTIGRTLVVLVKLVFPLFTPFCMRNSLKQPFWLTTHLFWNALSPMEDRRALRLRHLFRPYQEVRTATAVAPHRLFYCFRIRDFRLNPTLSIQKQPPAVTSWSQKTTV